MYIIIIIKVFKKSNGNLCMPFGFWLSQLDISSAVDMVLVSNT